MSYKINTNLSDLMIPGMGILKRASILITVIGAQHMASVNTIRKKRRANSDSPRLIDVAVLVFKILMNIDEYTITIKIIL